MNTLANMAGTPGVTLGAIMTGAPAAAPGVFAGYTFSGTPMALGGSMPASMFRTTWIPFGVTGAYAFVLGAPFVGATPALGAGVGMLPFTSTTGTWAAFDSAAATLFGPFSPGMVYGMAGIFTGTMAPMVTMTGQGIACGFDVVAPGAVLGGLTPGTGGGKPINNFVGPGAGSGAGPIAAPPATYVAGCYISGSTVPVELQSYSVE